MSNRYTFDQGTIVYGIKSLKYPDSVCYGIIITASCDIAQSKVSKYYYLLGIPVADWLNAPCTLQHIFGKDINNKKQQASTEIAKCNLDAAAFATFSDSEREKVINEKVDRSKRNKIMNAIQKYIIASNVSTISDIHNLEIKSDEKIKNKLIEITQGRETHYYYLPQKAFLDSIIMDDGLIVDLQEIGCILPEEIQIITANRGIDITILSKLENEMEQLLKKDFCLENEESCVDIEGSIKSPWREHLMQRFSYGFIRIGLEDFDKQVFPSIIKRSIGGK